MARPLQLAIEAVGVKHSGGATVLLDLLDEIECDSRIARVFLFCSARSVRRFSMDRFSKVHEIEAPTAEAPIGRIRWIHADLPKAVRNVRADVLLCFNAVGTAPPNTPKACFVQQSIPFSREALKISGIRARIRFAVIRSVMKRAVRSAKITFVQTPTMSSWVANAFGLSDGRLETIIPCVPEFPVPDAPVVHHAMEGVPRDRRLLYVGNDSGYKNVGAVIEALMAIRAAVPAATLFLTWPPEHSACRHDGVVGLGYLQGAALRSAYESASVFVLPSLVESGNVTMMEAMSLGVPVIAADRPYAHDLCGDAAVFVDPLDPNSIAQTVVAVLRDSRLRAELVLRGRDLVKARRDSRPYRTVIDRLCALSSDGCEG